MVPVFIERQIKQALRVAADKYTSSEITKKSLLERIMGRLEYPLSFYLKGQNKGSSEIGKISCEKETSVWKNEGKKL